MIKNIDMKTYARREHFEHFLAMANPFVNVTVQLDITDWLASVKAAGKPVFLSFLYAVGRAANRVPEFRQRIRNGGIIEYDECRISYIVLRPDRTYRYCFVSTEQPFDRFIAEARKAQEKAADKEHLSEEGDPEQMIYTSCVPWLSYSSLSITYPDASFTVPTVTWGKYCEENGRVRIPVTVMTSHALVDGINTSEFYMFLEENLKAQI